MTDKEMIMIFTRKETPEELADLIIRCYKEKPKRADLLALREYLEATPELYKVVFDLSEALQENMINKMIDQKPVKMAIQANVIDIKNGMGYEHAPIIEKMLIDNVVITWLRYQWAEYQLSAYLGRQVRMSVVDWWERRTSAAQRRYLRAIETLARVRKLARNTPALQVNIAAEGGQQVNVGGDLNK